MDTIGERPSLGHAALIGVVVGSTTPETVVAGVFPTALATITVPSIAPVVALVAIVLAVFSVGFVGMARELRTAGTLPEFVARGLAPWAGGGTAGVALVAYLLLQVAFYGAIGSAVVPLLPGAGLPWWVVALVTWLVVGVLGALRITVSTTVVTVLLTLELLAVVAGTVVLLASPGPSGSVAAGLDPSVLAPAALGPVLGVVVLAFLGFEQAAVYAPEARHGVRSVRIATVTGLALITVLYVATALAYSSAAGPDLPALATQQGAELWYFLIGRHSPALAVVNQVMFAVALLVGAQTFHNTTARYVGSLPSRWTGTDRAARIRASLAVSAVGLVVIAVVAVSGVDPLTTLFFLGATAGGVGVLVVLTVVALAVCCHQLRIRRQAPGPAALSVLAVIGMGAICATVLSGLDALLGTVVAEIPALTVTVYTVVALAGIALTLRRQRATR